MSNRKQPKIQTPVDMRERAVDLARRGFRVFKLEVNGKRPAIEKFYDVASNDNERVRAMWTCPVSGDSLDNNIGVLTGEDYFVLDIDVKEKRPGIASLRELADQGLPLDAAVTTPSGGLHIYLSKPRDALIPNSANKWPGIDVRGHHGYVLGPGSLLPTGEYLAVRNLRLTSCGFYAEVAQ